MILCRCTCVFFYSLTLTLLLQSLVVHAVVEVGQLPGGQHGIGGTVELLSTTRIRLRGFSYDGRGPASYIYYFVPGAAVITHEGTIVPLPNSGLTDPGDDRGAFKSGVPFNNQDVTFDLPAGSDVCDIGTFTIWCETARSFFTKLVFPRELFNGTNPCNLATTVPGPPPTLDPGEYQNCEVMDPSLQLYWTVNTGSRHISFMLLGCQSSNMNVPQYMGFGLSGSPSGTFMEGADVTIAWVDNSRGARAQDYHLQRGSRTQCRGGMGVCPDVSDIRGTCMDNVKSVSGKNLNRQQIVSFTRPFTTSDTDCDLAFDPDREQFIVWAIGGVEETAFRHFTRSSADTGPLHLGRSPLNNCQGISITCDSCDPFPAQKITALTNNTVFTARIGPSGNDRGYVAITNRSGWGIAWYINDLLIPELVVQRGNTYKFVVEGGDDPSDSSNYHPFYITNSPQGGRLQNTKEQRDAETIFAGFNGETETAFGRLCVSVETEDSFRILERCGDQEAFKDSLMSSCRNGEPGMLIWTPDENTLDTVYYQCATHRNLGWKIKVVNSTAAASLPSLAIPVTLMLTLLLAKLFM